MRFYSICSPTPGKGPLLSLPLEAHRESVGKRARTAERALASAAGRSPRLKKGYADPRPPIGLRKPTFALGLRLELPDGVGVLSPLNDEEPWTPSFTAAAHPRPGRR